MASNLVRRLANSTFSFVVQDGRPHETGCRSGAPPVLPGGTLRGHARAGGGPFIRGHTSRVPRRSSSGAARRCCQAAGGRALHSLPPSIPPFFGWGVSRGLTEPRAKPATTTAKPEKPAHEPRSHPGPTNPVHIQGPRTPFTSRAHEPRSLPGQGGARCRRLVRHACTICFAHLAQHPLQRVTGTLSSPRMVSYHHQRGLREWSSRLLQADCGSQGRHVLGGGGERIRRLCGEAGRSSGGGSVLCEGHWGWRGSHRRRPPRPSHVC